MGEWMDPRAGLDAVGKRKKSKWIDLHFNIPDLFQTDTKTHEMCRITELYIGGINFTRNLFNISLQLFRTSKI
jgi:hypothetical protein